MHARDSQLTVDRSTFIGNYTFGVGGAILVSSIEPETMDVFGLFDSTLYENVADGDGDDLGGAGGLALVGFPGDLHSAFVNNNAIAENVDPGTVSWPDIYATGLGFTTATTNLIGINTDMEFQFPAGDPNADINYVGDAASPMRARFLAFSNYGGPTPVLMPSPIGSSRLIDRGLCQLPAGDQRGYLNPQSAQRAVDSATFPNGPGSDGCDIGAVETEAAATPNAEIFVDGFE